MYEIIGFIVLFILILFKFLWKPYTLKTSQDGAPFVTMEPEVVGRVIQHAQIKPGDVFYELGSGDGRLVIAAALKGAKAYGIEIDWLRVVYSRFWLHLLRLHHQAHILHQNVFDIDLSGADIVCLYLLQETNQQIQKKLERELKVGTLVISIAFDFPGWEPIKVDPYGTIYGPIYIYRIHERND